MAGWSDLARATNPGNGDLKLCRLRGGAGRTRTNHQSVMEHGWCPTSPARRTPVQIAGWFAVLLDFLGFLILVNHQSVMEHGWCPTNYPGRTPSNHHQSVMEYG